MRQVLLIIFCILTAHVVSGQIKSKFYNWKWEECESYDARFLRITKRTDSGWYCADYFVTTKKPQMTGCYEDSSLKIRNGVFSYYFASGNLQSTGRYLHGKKEGAWILYHYNGMKYDSSFYSGGKKTGTWLAWHNNGYRSDSTVLNADNSGTTEGWYDNGNIAYSGSYKDRHMNGEWKFYHMNGNIASQEVYELGKLKSKIFYDETGKQSGDTSNIDRDAEYKGGERKWRNYLLNNLQWPEGYSIKNTDEITIVLTAKIDADGKVQEVYVDIPFGKAFDDEAVRVMKNSPAWNPRISHNRRISDYIKQPITFIQGY